MRIVFVVIVDNIDIIDLISARVDRAPLFVLSGKLLINN